MASATSGKPASHRGARTPLSSRLVEISGVAFLLPVTEVQISIHPWVLTLRESQVQTIRHPDYPDAI